MNTTPLRLRPFLSNLKPYTPGEQVSGANIIKLNTNENPYPPCQAVIDAVATEAKRLHLYPNPTGENLRRVLADYHAVNAENILVGNGSDEILRLLIQAFVSKGQSIAMTDPSYSLYPVLSATMEGGATLYPLVDRTDLPEEVFSAPEPILLLPNPNPPIGTLYSHAQMARLCEERPDRLVVIDEAYVDFAPRDAIPLLSRFRNLAITRTFSKSFSLAGMRVGYVMADPALIKELIKIKDSYNLSRLAQTAATAAISSYKDMRRNADAIIKTREETATQLKTMGYKVPESHGNFVFAIHQDAHKHFQRLHEQGILVRYFNNPLLADGMRITIGTPEQMERFFEALSDILDSQ